MARITDKLITKLESMGFNRWQKGSMDRLYINSTTLGLTVERYKTGNVSYAEWRGERISNSRGSALAAAKTYINVATGTLYSTSETAQEAAQELYDQAIAELEAEEAAAKEAEATESAENAESTEEATESTYPALTGSAKEIARAEGIRRNYVSLAHFWFRAEKDPDLRLLAAAVMEWALHTVTDARAWIAAMDELDSRNWMHCSATLAKGRLQDVADYAAAHGMPFPPPPAQ